MSFKKYKEEILKDPRASRLNFEPDGRSHYVYRVSSLLEEEYYYGSKSELLGITKDSLGIKYFTGSEFLRYKFKDNPIHYKIKIIRRFDNPADKILFECYLHNYFNVKEHSQFINRMNQLPWGFDYTGVKVSEETRKKTSKSSIKSQAKIKADPVRYAKRSAKLSKTTTKMNKEIAADPERYQKRQRNQIKSALKREADIEADPKRKANKIKKASEADAKIVSDPKRFQERREKRSKTLSKPVSQYDLEGNFIRAFPSRKLAALELGYPEISGASSISQCCVGRIPHYKGFIWKNNLKRKDIND